MVLDGFAVVQTLGLIFMDKIPDMPLQTCRVSSQIPEDLRVLLGARVRISFNLLRSNVYLQTRVTSILDQLYTPKMQRSSVHRFGEAKHRAASSASPHRNRRPLGPRPQSEEELYQLERAENSSGVQTESWRAISPRRSER